MIAREALVAGAIAEPLPRLPSVHELDDDNPTIAKTLHWFSWMPTAVACLSHVPHHTTAHARDHEQALVPKEPIRQHRSSTMLSSKGLASPDTASGDIDQVGEP